MRFLHHVAVLFLSVVLALATGLGCASPGGSQHDVTPVRISDLIDRGDASRRASLRLVDDGLAADTKGEAARAQARYDRALQVDATNPYAYLAIARHHVEARDSARALQYLDRAESLLRLQGDPPPQLQVHLIGLRGCALYDSGETREGAELLDRARELAPRIWGDGTLHSEELR